MSQRLRHQWHQTRTALDQGGYSHQGRWVDLGPHLEAMRAGTRLYRPEDVAALPAPEGHAATRVEVTGESTLRAARRLAADGPTTALNFASARNPGGGVTNGANAQEESLARASALYDSLTLCPRYYEHHRRNRDLCYTDHLIHSPQVAVFRDDDGSWLAEPVPVAFVTAAAPNHRMVRRNTPEKVGDVTPALRCRARAILAVAAHQGAAHLVLGAWGCGVFGNDPAEVAAAFADPLTGTHHGVFQRVVFAVLDRPDGPARRAFDAAFG